MRYNKVCIFVAVLTMVFHAVGAQDIPVESLENRVEALSAGGSLLRAPGSPESEVAAEYIAGVFEQSGLRPYYSGDYIDEFTVEPLVGNARKTYRNVAGIIYGSDLALDGEYIVIGAHYDFDGGNDNASGVAALMELAHSLKQCSPGRNIILAAFDGYELGLLGSRRFIDESSVPADHICLMVNIQGIGGFDGDDIVNYYLSNLTEKNAGYFIVGSQYYNASVKQDGYKGRTDTEPFSIAGIPTIQITTWSEEGGSGDKFIEFSVLEEMTRLVSGAVCSAANAHSIDRGQNASKNRKKGPLFEGGITALGGTSFVRQSDGGSRGKTMFSYGAGLYGQLNLSYFGLRPEVQFIRSGSRYATGNIHMNSLVVPVSLVAQTPRYIAGSIHLFVGGYYRYTFGGKAAGEDMDFSNVWYRNGAGMQWGIGMKFRHFGIEVTNRYGLTDMLRGNSNKMTERATYATLSYKF